MGVLEKSVQDKIDSLIDSAYEDFQDGNFDKYYEKQLEAWGLFPEPKNQWNEGYNIAKYIFEDKIKLNEVVLAKKWLNEMIECNNNLHLMDFNLSFNIGKYYFETEKYKEAIDEWKNLVSQRGFRYFENEDPKYLDFYKNPEKYIKK